MCSSEVRRRSAPAPRRYARTAGRTPRHRACRGRLAAEHVQQSRIAKQRRRRGGVERLRELRLEVAQAVTRASFAKSPWSSALPSYGTIPDRKRRISPGSSRRQSSFENPARTALYSSSRYQLKSVGFQSSMMARRTQGSLCASPPAAASFLCAVPSPSLPGRRWRPASRPRTAPRSAARAARSRQRPGGTSAPGSCRRCRCSLRTPPRSARRRRGGRPPRPRPCPP